MTTMSHDCSETTFPSLRGLHRLKSGLRIVVRRHCHNELDIPYFTTYGQKSVSLSWGVFSEIVCGPVVLSIIRNLNLDFLSRLCQKSKKQSLWAFFTTFSANRSIKGAPPCTKNGRTGNIWYFFWFQFFSSY